MVFDFVVVVFFFFFYLGCVGWEGVVCLLLLFALLFPLFVCLLVVAVVVVFNTPLIPRGNSSCKSSATNSYR